MHFGRDAIIPKHGPWVAHPDRFALDDKAPESMARVGDQTGAGGVPRAPVSFVFRKSRQCDFERAPQSSECSNLFLGDLIVERRRARHSRT
jgi:hypothetical protein